MHQLWTSATGADYHNFSAIFTHDDIEVRTRDLIVRGYALDFQEIIALILIHTCSFYLFSLIFSCCSLLSFPIISCCYFLLFPAVMCFYFLLINILFLIITHYFPFFLIISYYFLLFCTFQGWGIMLKNIEEQEQACAHNINSSSSSTCLLWRRRRQRALTLAQHGKEEESKRIKKGNGEELLESLDWSEVPGVAFYYPL